MSLVNLCILIGVSFAMSFGVPPARSYLLALLRPNVARTRYNRRVAEIREWIPQCSFIVVEEVERRNSFGWFSIAGRARRKSLRLIARAADDAHAIRRHELSRTAYVACRELSQLQHACLRCQQANLSGRSPRCLVQERDVFDADLEFHNQGEN